MKCDENCFHCIYPDCVMNLLPKQKKHNKNIIKNIGKKGKRNLMKKFVVKKGEKEMAIVIRQEMTEKEKQDFLKTRLGMELTKIMICWNKADYKKDEEMIHNCSLTWAMTRLVLKEYHHVEYGFLKTDKYFGIHSLDGQDWLIKLDRYGIIKERGIYKNKDNKCECWKCELENICPYAVGMVDGKIVPKGEFSFETDVKKRQCITKPNY